MVQWFKRRKEKKAQERLLSFNREKIHTEMGNLSDALYPLKHEISFKLIKEVVQLARNAEILEVNAYRTHDEIQVHRGRLMAFTDLLSYLENAATFRPAKEEKKTPEGQHTIRTIRKTTNQAGAAI